MGTLSESRQALYQADLASQQVTLLHAFENNDIEGLIFDLTGSEGEDVCGYADVGELRARSPVHNAASMQVPVLVIQGKAD